MDPDNTNPPPSFFSRTPTQHFDPPTQGWRYLPQINEKFRLHIGWEVLRVPGESHIPTFKATPLWRHTPGAEEKERLEEYARTAGSKKVALEAAAEAMALGGHC